MMRSNSFVFVQVTIQKHKHIKFTIKKAGILRTFEKMEPANVFIFDKLCQKDIKDFVWVLINP